jgi:hypothetical protein
VGCAEFAGGSDEAGCVERSAAVGAGGEVLSIVVDGLDAVAEVNVGVEGFGVVAQVVDDFVAVRVVVGVAGERNPW